MLEMPVPKLGFQHALSTAAWPPYQVQNGGVSSLQAFLVFM